MTERKLQKPQCACSDMNGDYFSPRPPEFTPNQEKDGRIVIYLDPNHILAPTTLLAEQHYQTLVDRFSRWPVKVAEVSRFRSGKEVTAALGGDGARNRPDVVSRTLFPAVHSPRVQVRLALSRNRVEFP